nr:hypothetical protein [Rubrivivax gelatinosus]
MSAATTGTPRAMASSAATPKASARTVEGMQNTSASSNQASTSSDDSGPVKNTRDSSPAARTWPRYCARPTLPPPPTTTSTSSGSARAASISTSQPL